MGRKLSMSDCTVETAFLDGRTVCVNDEDTDVEVLLASEAERLYHPKEGDVSLPLVAADPTEDAGVVTRQYAVANFANINGNPTLVFSVADPVEARNATSRKYVDEAILDRAHPKGGNTATTLVAPAPEEDDEVVTKGYADENYNKAGGDSTTTLKAADPEEDDDVVTLGYANTHYADIGGSTSHDFKVPADPASSDSAVSMSWGLATFAKVHGNSNNTFKVAEPQTAEEAVNLGYFNNHIYDALDGLDTTSALSAKQGKRLNDRVVAVEDTSHSHTNKDVLDNVGATEDGKLTYNGNTVDTVIAQRDVYDGLDSDDSTISLSAKQGKRLNEALHQKEPAFSKASAFNKFFGTGHNDVARGDHDHGVTYASYHGNVEVVFRAKAPTGNDDVTTLGYVTAYFAKLEGSNQVRFKAADPEDDDEVVTKQYLEHILDDYVKA